MEVLIDNSTIENIIGSFTKVVRFNRITLIFLLLLPTLLYSQPKEYTMKAILLSKIINYFEWPNSSDSEFTIGVIGENRFGDILDELFIEKIKSIKSKNITILYFESFDALKRCDLLFISPSMIDKIDKILDDIGKDSILLFSDSDGMGDKGVHINFFVENGKVKFELNEDSIIKSGLKFDYRLRRIAKPVSRLGARND